MSGGGRRAGRFDRIFAVHEAELVRLAFDVWQRCVPAMALLTVSSHDYRAVQRLQRDALEFARTITGGKIDFGRGGSTTAGDDLPGEPIGRDAEVDDAIAECAGDPRLAIRALLDQMRQIEGERQS